MKNLLFCSILLIAFGCNSLKEKKEGGNSLDDGSYNVTSIAGTDVSSEKLTVVISEEGKKVSGFCGCNTYFGGINPHGSATYFSSLARTKKYCTDRMTTEELFLEEMQNVASISTEGNTVNLNNTGGETIIIASKE